MTNDEKNQLSDFEARVRQLLFLHDELKAKYAVALHELEKKEQALGKLREEYAELESDYTHLKQARIISIRDKDVNDTRKRLSALVREIDKCLALLNGQD